MVYIIVPPHIANSPIAFKTWYKIAEALNVAGLICLVFLLASYTFLPAEKTRRHYLSYCLIIAAIWMAVSSHYMTFFITCSRLTARFRDSAWSEA